MSNYKLVPVEPTPKMLQVWKSMYGYSRYDKYKAMLVEAPIINIVATKNEQGQIVSVTLQDEDHRILEVIAEADVQGEPVGYIRRSALELMKNDELGVRGNIIKEPRYRDCVALYTAPQPAEQQPEVLAKGYFHPLPDENDYEFHAEENFPDGNDCPDCVPAVIVRKSAVAIQPATDVTVLVEALERISKRASEAECRQTPCGPIQRLFVDIMQQADDALAAHRKQQGTSHDEC